MKIKRYMADSMRTALAKVRAEQGPDAVILSSRRVEEGIEVIAAVDYDEALFVDAVRPRAAAEAQPQTPVAPPQTLAAQPAPAPVGRQPQRTLYKPTADATPTLAAVVAPRPAPAAARIATPRVVAAAVPAAAAAPVPAVAIDVGYKAMQSEIRGLRELLEGGLKHMSWNDKRMTDPLQTRILEELTAMDIAPDVALSLAKLTPKTTNLHNPSHIPMALLVRHIPVVEQLTTVNPGIIALVGPTGAGKTTTIAKLAARWSMEHGSQDLALVSTDGYRIGAREQLMTYARILGAPMHVANNGKELARVLERLKAKKLVLIDTAGMGPRDVRLGEQLAALQLGAARAQVMLALPAQGESHSLEEIVRAFAKVSPSSCILTKVDEAASLGGILSTTLRHKLKISYLCNGQRVPEDFHPAHQHRVWLAMAAVKLREHAAARGETYLARNFGGAQAHA